MELAVSISLFLAMFALWCILPNGPAPEARTEPPPHGATQQA